MNSAVRSTTDLPRHLALAYALLVVYACLHPFSGWHESGLPPFDFLDAPWPRYYRQTDLILNLLGFLPLGFMLVPAMPRSLPARLGTVVPILICALLSLTLETLQNFLPTRVASNLDLGFNALGGLIGALLGARYGHRLFAREGGIHRWRSRRILKGHMGDAGLILLALWLFTQLDPESLVFASGDLRQLFALPTALPFSALEFLRLETAITASHMLAVGLLAHSIMREPSPWPIVALIVLALATRTLAGSSFFLPGDPLNWATPGCRAGIIIGLPLLLLGLMLPRALAHGLTAITLLAATALVNLAPENPYLLSRPSLLSQSHFLNFHGATQLVSSLWPFLALAYLSLLGALQPGMRR